MNISIEVEEVLIVSKFIDEYRIAQTRRRYMDNRKELRVKYAQSNTTIITSINNIIGINNNYMFRPYMWAITRL